MFRTGRSSWMFSQEATNAKYLGLPVCMVRSKANLFTYLKERICKRLQGWKEKLLSKAGKDILIKSIAQAIPSYAMSCFDLTKSLCDDISQMICRFWWAQQDKERKMHWVSCDIMSSRKEKWGLGFRDLHLFNLAMLARQDWRIIQNSDALCAQVLRAKYGNNGSLLNAQEGPGISYTWRSIIRGFQALNKGLIWRMGDCSNIQIWEDPWTVNGLSRRPITPRRQTVLTRVEELIEPETRSWDVQLVRDVFWEEDAKYILATPTNPGYEDSLAWHFDRRGVFSVKSAYHVLDDEKGRLKTRQGGSCSTAGCTEKNGPVPKTYVSSSKRRIRMGQRKIEAHILSSVYLSRNSRSSFSIYLIGRTCKSPMPLMLCTCRRMSLRVSLLP
jgi:hypothetical protein